ncbi:LppM family (lipo)protein [Cellulomonas triticagri]|uniref:LppM domain-containing protein n=1 Tax=Cellulomonas triticagri TaxID=2483352 RepID=A0A3M2JBD7_9CELL|nr:hypothetical protein [Cellulomonas triticagri]RMI09536.1 hypothetical protein EBM89_09755 [Cellulomonas triticagri]
MTSARRTTRASRAVGLALVLVAALAGCFRIDMGMEVHADDTVSGNYVLAMSRSVVEASGSTVDELFQDSEGAEEMLGLDADLPGVTLAQEPYEEGDWVGRRVTFSGVPLDAFNGDGMTITHADGRFEVDGELPSMTEGMPGASGEVRIAFTFPGDVLETNGEIDPDDPRTVEFTGDGSTATTIQVTASDAPSSPWLMIALLGGGGLLLVAAVVTVVVLLVRRRRRAAVPAFPGQPVYPTYPGVPPVAAGTAYRPAPTGTPQAGLPPYVAPSAPAPAWSDQQGTQGWQPDPPQGLAPGAVPQQPAQPPAATPYPPQPPYPPQH